MTGDRFSAGKLMLVFDVNGDSARPPFNVPSSGPSTTYSADIRGSSTVKPVSIFGGGIGGTGGIGSGRVGMSDLEGEVPNVFCTRLERDFLCSGPFCGDGGTISNGDNDDVRGGTVSRTPGTSVVVAGGNGTDKLDDDGELAEFRSFGSSAVGGR